MMNDLSALILGLFGGALLGTFFFGGLWWTIRKGISSRSPAFWFLGSLLLRTSLAVLGFYFVAQGDWRKLLACLLGFFVSRILITWLTRAPVQKSNFATEGSGT